MKQLNLFKTMLLLLCLLTLGTSPAWGEVVTWSAASAGYTNAEGVTDVTVNSNISFTFDKGTGSNAPMYYTTGSAVRCYGGNTIAVNATDATITGIEFSFSSGEGTNAITADAGTFSSPSWSGSESAVTFSIGGTTGHRRISSITVTYTTNGSVTPTTPVDASWSVSPMSVSVKEGKKASAEITTNYDGELTVSSSNDAIATATISDNVITVTGVAEGNTTLTITGPATEAYNAISKTINVTVLQNDRPVNEIFYESFDKCEGEGGNDGEWNNTLTSNKFECDNVGWDTERPYGASACARFGTGSALGSATTPALGYTGDATLTFKAAAWDATRENTTLKLSIIGSGNIPTTVTLEKGEWTTYTLTLTGLTPDSKIKFEGNSASNSRFFLDEVSVEKAKSIVSIAVSTAPAKTTYTEGETFNPSGLVITTTYSDESTEDIVYVGNESEFSFEPSLSTALQTANEEVIITYKGKKTTLSISVNPAGPLTTIEEIFAKATVVGNTATDVRITFNNWVVSGVSFDNANVYVTDGTKGFVIYDYSGNHGFKVGDKLSGTVSCKVQLYRGSAELTALTSTTDGLTVTGGGAVTEQEMSISELSGLNTGTLLAYENLTCHLNGNRAEFSDGTNTIVAYDKLIENLPHLVDGKRYDVKGVFLMFDSQKEILPRSNSDITLKDPLYSFDVVIETPDNGRLVIKDGETTINTTGKVTEGNILTIECVPASDDYRFKSWGYKVGEADWVESEMEMSMLVMPSADIMFRAEFEAIPTYDISFIVNGTIVKTDTYKENEVITPPTVETYYGKVFAGWVTSETVESDVEPDYKRNMKASDDVTYYAVFATKDEAAPKIYTFTIETSAFKGTGYVDNNGVHEVIATATDGSEMKVRYVSTDVMLNNQNLQFKKNSGNLYNTTDLGTIKSVSLKEGSTGLDIFYGNYDNPIETTEISGGFFSVKSTESMGITKSITVEFEQYSYSHFTTQVRTLDISENDKLIQGDGYYDGVKVTRTINAERWSVLCLPFNISADQIAASFSGVTADIRRLTGLRVDGDVYKMIFSPVTSMEKGIPYLIRLSGKKDSFIVNDVTVDCTGDLIDKVNAADDEVILHGTYEYTNAPIGDEYKIIASNQIYTVSTDVSVKCTGGYFEMPSAPMEYTASFPNTPTYTINWKVNGKYETPVTLTEGSDLQAPSVADRLGKVFTGWVTTPFINIDEEPDYVDFGTTKATDKFIFHAVFATKEGEGERWIKVSDRAAMETGTYALISSDGHAFNGNFSSGNSSHGQQTEGTFSFDANGIATSAPVGTCELTITAIEKPAGASSNRYTIFSEADNQYLCITVTTSGNLKFKDGPENNYWDFSKNENQEEGAEQFRYHYNNTSQLRYYNSSFRNYQTGGTNGEVVMFAKKEGESAAYSEFTTRIGYIRKELSDGKLGTICLPYAVEIKDATGAEYYKIASYKVYSEEKKVLVLNVVEDNLEAGIPYVFRANDDYLFAPYMYPESANAKEDNGLVGTFSKLPFSDFTEEYLSDVYVITNNKVQKANANSGVVANRAYIKMSQIHDIGSSGAKQVVLGFDGDMTSGITNFNFFDSRNDNEYYNIAGQRVNANHKGIVIVNGRKYINK